MKKTPSEKAERNKAARFRVRIRIETMGGEFIETMSKHMTEKSAAEERRYWQMNGHPEAVVVEEAPQKPREPGRMSKT